MSTSLTFSDGDLRRCVEIRLIDDNMEENLESFRVDVGSNDLPIFRSQAFVNILADGGEELFH